MKRTKKKKLNSVRYNSDILFTEICLYKGSVKIKLDLPPIILSVGELFDCTARAEITGGGGVV